MTPFFGSRNILILFVGLVFCLVHNLRSATLYVDAHNPGPVLPYNTWANAATNVQDAVDLAVAGDEVLVTNGLYQTGGRALAGGTTNRVAITNAILVHSVNGPYQTFITGYQPPGTTNGPDAIRCVHLAAGAVLSGFTLANGATMASGSDDDQRGGGVVCESRDAIITNCVLTANVSWLRGGGVYSGSLDHCWLAGNRSVRADGGGAGGALLNSCVISSNQAAQGGGAASSTLYNCTVAGNYAFVRGSGSGVAGGTANCQAYNTIIYYNGSASGLDPNAGFGGVYLFCCSTPDLGWAFNITNEPAFADLPVANFHLQTNSPCINSGANLYAAPGPDLDGNPRVSGGKPDIGAFEVQNPRSIISYAWLAANGFSADGSADFADPDGDHMNNWQEWIAGTDPQDAASVLKMYAPAPGSDPNSVILSWSGISGRCYFLERATTLTPPDFTDLVFVSNLVVQSGTNYYQDVLPAGTNAAFYRVRTDSETIVFP